MASSAGQVGLQPSTFSHQAKCLSAVSLIFTVHSLFSAGEHVTSWFKNEVERMGFDTHNAWRISDINSKFRYRGQPCECVFTILAPRPLDKSSLAQGITQCACLSGPGCAHMHVSGRVCYCTPLVWSPELMRALPRIRCL